jgi:hypothetical protein
MIPDEAFAYVRAWKSAQSSRTAMASQIASISSISNLHGCVRW